jgi:monoamine oxidase
MRMDGCTERMGRLSQETRHGQPVDLLIVGAGLAGLTVAYTLHRQAPALHLRVLEARDRVGGRILTLAHGKGNHAFDLGPTWVWPGHSHVLALVERMGVQLFPQFEAGDALFDSGGNAPAQRFSPAQTTVKAWRLAGGVGTLANRLLAGLPPDVVICNQRVYQVEEQSHGLLVSSQSPAGVDSYLAQQVIVTLPPSLVAHTMAFAPALPDPITAAMRGTQTWMGQAMKVLLVYDRPFWREQGLSGLGVSHVGPVAQFHDASPADGAAGALFGWIDNHSRGRVLLPAERQQAIVQQAVRMFGANAAAVQFYADINWADERFTTSPSEPHRVEQQDPQYGHPLLQTPQMRGRLHWAGTEISPLHGGYLDGAVYSAQSVARRRAAP